MLKKSARITISEWIYSKYILLDDLDNKDEIDKIIGALQHFIRDWENTDLFDKSFGGDKNLFRKYVKAQISDWRDKYRNGYFRFP